MATRKTASRGRKTKARSKGGRPRLEIDWKVVTGLCQIFCTLEEIVSVLGISEDTLERACVREHHMRFADFRKKHSASGRMSLRRDQYQAAKRGNTTMLIWLGKQHLGQRDKIERDDTVRFSQPIEEWTDEELMAALSGRGDVMAGEQQTH